MATAGWERLAASTGIIFVPLYVGANVLLGGAGGDIAENTPAEVIARRLVENDIQVLAGATLAGLAAVAFLWFAGSLRSVLRNAEGGTGRLSAVTFGGGVATATMLVAGAVIVGSGTFDLADHLGLAEAAAGAYSLAGGFGFFGVAFGLGLTITPASVVGMRTGVLPRWLSIVGLRAGIALVVGWATFFATFIAGALALIWVLITSVLTARRVGSPAS